MGNEKSASPELEMSDSERMLYDFELGDKADEFFLIEKGAVKEVVQGRDIFARGGDRALALVAAYHNEPAGPTRDIYYGVIRNIALGYMARPVDQPGA